MIVTKKFSNAGKQKFGYNAVVYYPLEGQSEHAFIGVSGHKGNLTRMKDKGTPWAYYKFRHRNINFALFRYRINTGSNLRSEFDEAFAEEVLREKERIYQYFV